MLKNKLYQYFVREFFQNFVLVLMSLSLLMLLTQAARYLNLITEMGNSSLVYFQYTILNFPKIVEKTIPLSFLITIFFTISKLRNEKELNIFWYSGISEKRIFKIIIYITLIIFVFYYLLSVFLGPYFSSLARSVLAKSEFTLINSLVKEKNFNSPLKGLTIYVEENDKKGNLKKIFIYESSRTISAASGRLIKLDKEVFLELIDGISQEKNNNKISAIKFEKLLFDFSKFKTKNLKHPKFSERSISWLILNKKNIEDSREIKDLRYEINKRLIKPFFIFFISIICSRIIYIKSLENNKEVRLKYFLIFFIGFLSLVINEVGLTLSANSLLTSYTYFLLIFFICIVLSKSYFKNYKKK